MSLTIAKNFRIMGVLAIASYIFSTTFKLAVDHRNRSIFRFEAVPRFAFLYKAVKSLDGLEEISVSEYRVSDGVVAESKPLTAFFVSSTTLKTRKEALMRSQSTPQDVTPNSNKERFLAQEPDLAKELEIIEKYSPGIIARMLLDLRKIAAAPAGNTWNMIDEFELKFYKEI